MVRKRGVGAVRVRDLGATRSTRPSLGRASSLFRWLVTLGWLLVISATFAFGYWLARYDTVNNLATVEALRAELALLSEEAARAREERLRLERAHQMDREAKRQAQESLSELQHERLELIKRVSYLQRLVRDGKQGVIEVKALQLRKAATPGRFHFEILLSQLVPQDERTRGRAHLSVVLLREGHEEQLSLDALPGSSAGETALDFEHFQAIDGEIVLPDGVDAERLIVDIEPESGSFASSSEAYLWPSEFGEGCSPGLVLAADKLAGSAKVE